MDTIMCLGTFQEFKARKENMFQQYPEYQYAKVWLIFNIKADGQQKTRLVLSVYMTNARDANIYALYTKQELL